MSITTRELSKIAGVSEQTVRNYTREYSEFLSPAARGETGPRLFNDQDVQVFCTIASLRREGVPSVEIIERLRRGDVFVEITPKPQQATPSHNTAQQALVLVQQDLQRQINDIKRNQERLIDDALRYGRLQGAICALVAGAFVLVCLWLLVNGAP